MSVTAKSTKFYSGFTPQSIPGCSFWLDAADRSTLTLAGSSITQWRDKISNIPMSVLGGSVSLTSNAFGPLPAATFATGYMTSGSNASTFTPANGVSFIQMYAVAKSTSSVGTSGQIVGLNFSNDNVKNVLYVISANRVQTQVRRSPTTTRHDGTLYPISLNTNYVFASRNDYVANTLHVDINGTVSTPSVPNGGGTATSSDLTKVMIGGNVYGGAEQLIGYVGECIIFNTLLTSAEQQQVEGYLAKKWSATTLFPTAHPYKLVEPYVQRFQPTDVPGCALWLDAADQTSLTLTGLNVTQWRDKSGNGRHVAPIGTAPTYTQVADAITFTTNNMRGNANYLHNSTNGTWSAFTVCRPTSLSANPRILSYDNSPNRVGQMLIVNSDGSTGGLGFTNGGSPFFAFTGAGSVSSNTRFQMSVVNSAAAIATYLNGNNPVTSSHGTNITAANSTFNVGAYQEGSFVGTYFTGQLFELLVYSNDLTTAQRQQVEGYLAGKWGIRTNLPTAHPFKMFPPLTPIFTPMLISGLALWLDAAESSTFTLSGSNITTWRDKSGNGRNALGFTGTGTYSSNGFNSRPTVQITPGGNMQVPIPAGTFSSGTILFVVFQKTGANNSADALVTRTVTYQPGPYDIYCGYNLQPTRTNRGLGDGTGGRGIIVDAVAVFRITTPTIYCINIFAATPGTWLERITGVQTSYALTGTTPYGDAATTFYIGTRADSFTKMTGNISEILIYNASSFSTIQNQQVEGYLAQKWGFQSSLPDSHPYKKSTP